MIPDASCRMALAAILKRAALSDWMVCDEIRHTTALTDEQIAELVDGPLVPTETP